MEQTAPGNAAANPDRSAPAKVLVVPVRAQISSPELYILRRGIKQAIDDKADTLILNMETPGGALDVTFEMLKALEKFPGKTVTYVNTEAISAGALIAAGTDEIHFAPGSVIGAAAPVLASGGEIDETMRQKIVSYLKARVRAISEGKGYRGDVVSAMIDTDYELKIADTVIKPKGELLSLTASEAVKLYGDPPMPLLGNGISPSLDDLIRQLHGPGPHEVRTLEVTWSEQLAQFLTAITPVLMGLGLLALFIEFKTPGFGIFGISGLILLGLVFFAQYAAGLSGQEPVLVFALGVALVIVDLFLFPGSMILALCGVVLMFGSLTWALVDHWPGQTLPEVTGDILLLPVLNVLFGIVIAVVLFLLILKFLPKGGPWSRMVLQTAVGQPVDGYGVALHQSGESTDGPDLTGLTGHAVTALFPSGQIEIAGRRYEAKLALGFAEPGARVKVIGKSGFGWMVEVLS
jgi:membrane-bound serine protease (ClpP class)